MTTKDTTGTLADRWGWLGRLRDRVCRFPGGRTTWRVLVAVVGLAVVVVGVLLVPLPGPGWAIALAGLGIWAVEFSWAGALIDQVEGLRERWADWRAGLSVGRRRLVDVATVVVVIVLVAAGLAAARWIG